MDPMKSNPFLLRRFVAPTLAVHTPACTSPREDGWAWHEGSDYDVTLGKAPPLRYVFAMSRLDKLYRHILLRRSDANVPFDGLCALLKRLGFEERCRGDHHIFTHADIPEILNLQPLGALAKAYRVKQVRELFLRYGFTLGD